MSRLYGQWLPTERFWLLKFSHERKYLEQLRSGSLYLNPLRYFTTREASESQRDPWEGADEVFAPGTVQLIAEAPPTVVVPSQYRRVVVRPEDLASHLRYASDRTSSLHVYCMYALLESSLGDQLRDAAKLRLGDWWVPINRPDVFFARVRERARLEHRSFNFDFVDYVNEAGFSGAMGPFRKRRAFERQCEARITLAPGGPTALTLEVGDLGDIVGPVHGIGELQGATPTPGMSQKVLM